MSDITKSPVTADAAAFASARGPAPAPAATPRLRRDEPAKKDTAKRLVPAASSFDLLDGEYAKNRKSRILSIVGLAVSLLVVVLMSAQLLRIRFEISSARADYNQYSDQGRNSKAALDQLSQFEGVPGDLVVESLEGRSLQAAAATEGEVDLSTIVNDLTSMVPSGLTITQIQVSTPTETTLNGKGKEKDAEKKSEDTTIPTAVITVLATADSINAIDPFLVKLKASETLSNFQETWAGSPPSITLRVEIKVPVGSSSRFSIYAKDAGLVSVDPAAESPVAEDTAAEGGS